MSEVEYSENELRTLTVAEAKELKQTLDNAVREIRSRKGEIAELRETVNRLKRDNIRGQGSNLPRVEINERDFTPEEWAHLRMKKLQSVPLSAVVRESVGHEVFDNPMNFKNYVDSLEANKQKRLHEASGDD